MNTDSKIPVAPASLAPISRAHLSLAEQRQILRQRIQAQRAVIAAQLIRDEIEEKNQPRSMLMRFLTQQNGLAIAAETAAVVLGTHWIKSAVGQGLSKIVQSLVASKLKA